MTSIDSAAALATRRNDLRGDRIALLRATTVVALGYGVGAALQSTYVYATYVPAWASIPLVARLGANAVAVVMLVAVLAAVQAHRATRLWRMAAAILVAAVVAALARFVAQVLFGVHPALDDPARDAEVFSGFLLGAISAAIGMWALVARRTNRARNRSAARDALLVELAVKALEQEEIRVRRAVAEGLHGTLQSKLVLMDAQDIETVASVRAELASAREIDVREMSRILYPDRLELGLVPALRALLGRIPASIATRLTVSDAVRSLDDPAGCSLTVSERLLAVRVVEEALTNALKHGPASSLAVSLDVADRELHIAVDNDGQLYDPAAAGMASGTARLATRLSFAGGRLALSPGHEKGARLEAWLPLGAGAE